MQEIRSAREIEMFNRREKMLDQLIEKYGHESAPVLFFAENAWKDIHNAERYFNIAIDWLFV